MASASEGLREVGAQSMLNALLAAGVIEKVDGPGERVRGRLSGGTLDLSTVALDTATDGKEERNG